MKVFAGAQRAVFTLMWTLVLISWVRPSGAEVQSVKSTDFPLASVHFEQNATDGDAEVVFEAGGGDDGLAALKVVAPDGRTVIDFNAPDSSTLGIRQFRMESPELEHVEALKAGYPEGKYTFFGKTFSGAALQAESTLRHRLPSVARIATPSPEANDVPLMDARIIWHAVAGVARYIVEIEQDDLGVRLEAVLPGGTTSFAVPDGFLLPGTEYKLAIGTVDEAGNISFVETSFATSQ